MNNGGIYSLLEALWYNGYGDYILKFYDHIKNNKDEYGHTEFPDKILDGGYNKPPNILWLTLVCEYGDYGVSPRYGWITERDECLECLNRFIKEFGIGYNE